MKLSGNTVLVTGGAGFVGSHIARRLIELKAKVVIIDNLNKYYDPSLKKKRLKHILHGKNFKFYKCDITNLKALERVFKENHIDIICHEAAQAGVRYSVENPLLYGRVNLMGTMNLLELGRLYGVKNFIFASSSSVYGEESKIPFHEDEKIHRLVSLYAATKKADETLSSAYHKIYGMSITALRYFTVYGPWARPDMALFKFTKAILNGDEVEVYNFGKMSRDFTYIDDIVDGTIRAMEKNYPFEIINIGTGNPRKLIDFIRAIERATGKKAKMKYLPLQKGDMLKTYADTTKAKNLLGWKPKVSMEVGVKNFVDWYRWYYHL
jgi:UDP-glucuronate 4-epimerase